MKSLSIVTSGHCVSTSVSGDAQAVNKQDFGLSFVKISNLTAILEIETHVFLVSAQNSLRDTEILQSYLKAHMFQTFSMNKLKFLGVWFCLLKQRSLVLWKINPAATPQDHEKEEIGLVSPRGSEHCT